MSGLPLFSHTDPDSVFACRAGETISVARFLHDVHALARELPDGAHVLNVCADRYRFCVGLAAALLRGQVTLLPPNQAAGTLERLFSSYSGCYRLSDTSAPSDAPAGFPTIAFPDLGEFDGAAIAVPAIPASQPATLMFTSGSTGEPLPHPKSWGTLVASAVAEGDRLGLTGSGTVVLATVPPQHMYGLESTVLMPLQCGLVLHAARPFYPVDVCETLAALPRPRALVTTPVHLRTLTETAGPLPAADLVVCATAPLSVALAREAELRFAAPLHEIYGCTEAGQVATRRTTESVEWQLLPGIRIRHDEQGPSVQGAHIEHDTRLSDMIEQRGAERFLLHGRNADLVNIAGKRTSLAHLNHQLTTIEGVRDGVFIVPDDGGDAVARLVAFVVAPGIEREAIVAALRSRIDPAFMPRPLTFVDELPRNATGKLPRAALRALETASGTR